MALKRGDKSSAVRTLQEALGRAGFPVGIDGVFGNETQNAVMTFQAARGVSSDGVVTDGIWSALGLTLPIPTSRSDMVVMDPLTITGTAPKFEIPLWGWLLGGAGALGLLALLWPSKKRPALTPAVAGYRRR